MYYKASTVFAVFVYKPQISVTLCIKVPLLAVTRDLCFTFFEGIVVLKICKPPV